MQVPADAVSSRLASLFPFGRVRTPRAVAVAVCSLRPRVQLTVTAGQLAATSPCSWPTVCFRRATTCPPFHQRRPIPGRSRLVSTQLAGRLEKHRPSAKLMQHAGESLQTGPPLLGVWLMMGGRLPALARGPVFRWLGPGGRDVLGRASSSRNPSTARVGPKLQAHAGCRHGRHSSNPRCTRFQSPPSPRRAAIDSYSCQRQMQGQHREGCQRGKARRPRFLPWRPAQAFR